MITADPRDTHTGELFQQAIGQAARARRWAERAKAVAVDEPTWSEHDCVSASLVATAGTTEDWILWAHLATRVPLPRVVVPATGRMRIASTPRLWRNLPMIARANRRPAPASLDPWYLLFLADLDTWYQSLHHHSAGADTDLRLRLSALGATDGDLDHRDMLVAPLASTAIVVTSYVFAWAKDVTGLDVPYATDQPIGEVLEEAGPGDDLLAGNAGLEVA